MSAEVSKDQSRYTLYTYFFLHIGTSQVYIILAVEESKPSGCKKCQNDKSWEKMMSYVKCLMLDIGTC